MSLILEALKKSEQQRRLGEAPTLGSPAIASRRRRGVLPIVAALIVVALGAGAWLMFKRGAPATDTTVAQTDPARKATPVAAAPAAQASKTPAPRAKPAAPTAAASPPAPPAATNPLLTSKRAAPSDESARAPLRANVPPGDRPGSVAHLPPALPAVAGPVPAVPAASTRKEAVPTAPAAAAAKGPAPDANAVATAKPETKPAIAATAPAKVAPAARPTEPILPSVWELTYSIRKDLPEMGVTMHVYADDPAERFVVIKGERHVEGDTIADGVTLKKIRPDGMELEFKGTRFTYPRDGR